MRLYCLNKINKPLARTGKRRSGYAEAQSDLSFLVCAYSLEPFLIAQFRSM
ncbi:MAG: hypothetical protein AB2693_07335 [Candidatus Thiodiazotropha sp.]